MNDELERRLVALEQPERLGNTLSKADLWVLLGLGIILPVIGIAIAWGW